MKKILILFLVSGSLFSLASKASGIKNLVKDMVDVQCKDLSHVQCLVKDLSHVKTKTKEVLLYEASLKSDKELVQTLLRIEGIDVDEKDEVGKTMFMEAMSESLLGISKALLENGADINAKDIDGNTALIQASDLYRGRYSYKSFPQYSTYHARAVSFLIANGADVNAKNNWEKTPLMKAVGHDTLEIAKVLLENGADINAKDRNGNTALMKIMYSDGGYLAEWVKFLIANGADVNAKNNLGETPLMEASAGYGNLEIAKVLIANGADVNAKNNWGETPLMEASAGYGNLEIAKVLIEAGADVHARDNNGRTAYDHLKIANNDKVWFKGYDATSKILKLAMKKR